MTDAERIHHLINDNEITRTHTIRTINDFNPLLDLALQALDAGDLHIVREFIERTRDALQAERAWLNER